MVYRVVLRLLAERGVCLSAWDRGAGVTWGSALEAGVTDSKEGAVKTSSTSLLLVVSAAGVSAGINSSMTVLRPCRFSRTASS